MQPSIPLPMPVSFLPTICLAIPLILDFIPLTLYLNPSCPHPNPKVFLGLFQLVSR